MERARGFEPLTTCLGSKDSTTELRPLTAPNPTPASTPSQSSLLNRAKETLTNGIINKTNQTNQMNQPLNPRLILVLRLVRSRGLDSRAMHSLETNRRSCCPAPAPARKARWIVPNCWSSIGESAGQLDFGHRGLEPILGDPELFFRGGERDQCFSQLHRDLSCDHIQLDLFL